uniref:(California timema) hypothetical protein n=1 Tax=Timema californicum TaxID=61474 RepID=A0A7R9IXE0_TIMCA|nr:unnamed protein product [Timema californicum]
MVVYEEEINIKQKLKMNVCVKGPLIKPVWYPPGVKTWNNLNNGSFGVYRHKPSKQLSEIHDTPKSRRCHDNYQDQDDNITFMVKEMAAKVNSSKKKNLAQIDNSECIFLSEEIYRIKLLIEERSHVINEMTDYKTKGYLHQKKLVVQLKEEMENNYKNFQKELKIFNIFIIISTASYYPFGEVCYKYTDVNKRLVTTIIELDKNISRLENYLI